jgi:hypothetical protein
VGVQPGGDLLRLQVFGLLAAQGFLDDDRFRLVVPEVLMVFDMDQGIVDQLGHGDEPLVPQIG